MRIVLLAKTLPSILHHYLLRHISLLWWWMLPTVSFPSWCILSWLGDILWDPVKELKYGDEPTFRHFPMPSLISFLNVNVLWYLGYTEQVIYHFLKDIFLFFCQRLFCGVILPSFCSSNFIFFPILLIFTLRKVDSVQVKIKNLLHESGYLAQQLIFCLPEFNCGGCVDRLLIKSVSCSWIQRNLLSCDWLSAKWGQNGSKPAIELCVEENTAPFQDELTENWENF